MARYISFTLTLNQLDEKRPPIQDSLSQRQKDLLESGNLIYIYRNTQTNDVYIGQTKHFLRRHREHYSGKEDKFNRSNFDQVMILTSVYFNKSALYDVENQLITYFTADREKIVGFNPSQVLNGNPGTSAADYKEKDKIISDVILPFWKEKLYPDWVNTPTLNDLRAKALFKYSPFRQLTDQQEAIIDHVLRHPDQHMVINGDAGTGKTVLLTHLVAKLLRECPNHKIAVIVQPNWLDTATSIFEVYDFISENLTIASSTTFINQRQKYDIVIVDEAHTLSRKGSKQMPSFNSIYLLPEFANHNSHLEALIDLSKQLVLMYDVLQAIRPANISREDFRSLTSSFEKCQLSTQFRIQTPPDKSYNSEDYINGIKYLLYKDTGLLEYTDFNLDFDRSVFQDQTEEAYFGLVDTPPLKSLIEWIEEDRNYNKAHINRILAGLFEDWKQNDGKDPNKTHFQEGDIKLRWNSTPKNWLYSSDTDAEDQIGSVFAVQGLDLNKVGVLMGKDLAVDKDGKLYADPDHFKNINGKPNKKDLKLPQYRQEFTIFVLNIYYVLLTRGIDGIRIGFWHNDALKEYVKKTLEIP